MCFCNAFWMLPKGFAHICNGIRRSRMTCTLYVHTYVYMHIQDAGCMSHILQERLGRWLRKALRLAWRLDYAHILCSVDHLTCHTVV